jgi:hypothetical protein
MTERSTAAALLRHDSAAVVVTGGSLRSRSQVSVTDHPEIILNLWYVHDDMGAIYSLRARAYVGYGSDEEKLALLKRFATTDYLIAQPFPIPERFQMTLGKTLGVAHASYLPAIGGVERLFEDVYVELEKQLPAQTKLSIGQKPLLCVTPLFGDDDGNIYPRFSGRTSLDPSVDSDQDDEGK